MTQRIDPLADAAAYVAPYLDCSLPIGDRLRNVWAVVVAASDLAASDVLEDRFMRLAQGAGLCARAGSPR